MICGLEYGVLLFRAGFFSGLPVNRSRNRARQISCEIQSFLPLKHFKSMLNGTFLQISCDFEDFLRTKFMGLHGKSQPELTPITGVAFLLMNTLQMV